jgi:hypothetical protein
MSRGFEKFLEKFFRAFEDMLCVRWCHVTGSRSFLPVLRSFQQAFGSAVDLYAFYG